MRVSAIGKAGADIGKMRGDPTALCDVASAVANNFRINPFHIHASAFARWRQIGHRAGSVMPDN
jgi:hypothetical protein